MTHILTFRIVSDFSLVYFNSFKPMLGMVNYRSIELTDSKMKLLMPCSSQQTRFVKTTRAVFALKRENENERNPSVTESYPKNNHTIKTLSKLLQCSENYLNSLCHDHNHLVDLNIDDIRTNIMKLKENGVENTSIFKNLWILSFKQHELSSKLILLNRWRFKNINNVVGFLQFPFKKLQKYTIQTEKDFNLLNEKNRITYFSSSVECDEKEACDLFLKYSFMMTVNLESFKTILSMAKDMGVLKEDLLSDPWLFKYSPQIIGKRIEFLTEIGAKEKCKVIKPWMLRCPQATVDRYFELRDENKAALGSYTNIKDLLSNELDLNDAEVEDMFAKHPPLVKIRYSKAKEMIDFLKSEGFSSKMIYQVPRVLCHKQATLLARMLELKKVNPRMMSLQNVCRNKKDYLAFLNKMQGPHT